MMTSTTPESLNKRSFVYRKLTDATFSPVSGGAMALDVSSERKQAELSGLLDLSVLSRRGFRGTRAMTHLEALQLPVPIKPNLASTTENGELVLRLSQKEFWVLGSLQDKGASIDTLDQCSLPVDNCYPLFCQDSHAWLMMTGVHLPEIMAKVCGVDLREHGFPLGAIAQTSVARINVIVIHHQLKGIPCFSILCDSAAAEYLWDCLLDAMGEFGGKAIGISALVE